MNTKNTNANVRYVNSAKFPIQFEKLHPGSLFKIVSEKDRGIKYSNDNRIYRRAQDHEGFYATVEGNSQIAACLHPHAMVQPVKKERV